MFMLKRFYHFTKILGFIHSELVAFSKKTLFIKNIHDIFNMHMVQKPCIEGLESSNPLLGFRVCHFINEFAANILVGFCSLA
jgi:hypothetical protein